MMIPQNELDEMQAAFQKKIRTHLLLNSEEALMGALKKWLLSQEHVVAVDVTAIDDTNFEVEAEVRVAPYLITTIKLDENFEIMDSEDE